MKTSIFFCSGCAILFLIFACTINAFAGNDLQGPFDLSIQKEAKVQYYSMESRMNTISPAGVLLGSDVMRLKLRWSPAALNESHEDEITCLQFTFTYGDSHTVEIPALINWSYKINKKGIDEKGQVFGIDHGIFENIIDSENNPLPADKAYYAYNAFIDFHSFCNVFAEPESTPGSVKDLHYIGDKVVHYAANSKAPTNLGSNIKEGSFFQNGEITLALKGISLSNDHRCALLAYDSGASSFQMIISPMPNMDVTTTGSSHYFGDIYKSLDSGWVEKATMVEFVVSETVIPMAQQKINSVVERDITIQRIDVPEQTVK